MVVNNVVDGQAYPVVVEIEAASQLSVAMVASGRVAEHLSAAVMLLVKRGRAQRDGDKVVLA